MFPSIPFLSLIPLIILTSTNPTNAHGTHSHSPSELTRRQAFQSHARRSLASCQSKLDARGHMKRGVERRSEFARKVREARGLPRFAPFNPNHSKRDLTTVLNTSHLSNLTGITNTTDTSILFGSNSSCVLAPEVTQGPYYVDGEYIRSDLRENQTGVDLYVDVEFIDTSTCESVEGLYIDFWHANATGVYSGIVANGNGNSNDTTNLNNTFLRGIQPTNAEGVAQFLTIFPGHYTGRVHHIHVMAHQLNSTNTSISTTTPITNANNTLNDFNATSLSILASHVGQLFFDQSLISSVELTSPYASNTQPLTTNAEDGILAQEAEGIDPMLEYVLLGNSVEDGVLGWASVGIDLSAGYSIGWAARLTESGGVVNPNGGGGGPPGGGNGTMPSGIPPNGTATATATGVATTDDTTTSATTSSADSSTVSTDAILALTALSTVIAAAVVSPSCTDSVNA